jgi:hypothetical protein
MGTMSMGTTVNGLIITVEIGLFGFQDVLAGTDATASLVVKIIALVVLVSAPGSPPSRAAASDAPKTQNAADPGQTEYGGEILPLGHRPDDG